MNIFSKHKRAIAVLAVFLGAGVAEAQTKLQLSTGATYSSGKYGETTETDVIVVPFSARVTTGNWAFRASIPYVTVDGPGDVTVVLDDNGGGRGGGSSNSGSGSGSDDATPGVPGSTTITRDGSHSGLGDASLSATYSFNEIAGSNFYSDLTGRVRLPTGDDAKGLGTGATDYFATTEIGYEFDKTGVYVEGGRRFLGDANGFDREDGWQAGAGFWWTANSTVSGGAGVDWRESSTGLGDDPSEASAYINYKLTPALRVGLDAGAGLNDASPDFSVGVSFAWRPSERRK